MTRKTFVGNLFILMVAANVAAGSLALAQSADADALAAVLKRPPHDTVDTALIFTNLGRSTAVVIVRGFTSDGEPAGDAEVKVPARGVAYVLASDLRPASNDTILGHAQAFSRNTAIVGTAVLVGIGTTDLPVITRSGVGPLPVPEPTPEATESRPGTTPATLRYTKMIFPVIAVN